MVVYFVEISVKSSQGVKSAGKSKFGNGRRLFVFAFFHKVLQPYDIDVIGNVFAYVFVKKSGKVIFVVTESRGKRVQRNGICVINVDVVEYVYKEVYAAVFFHGYCGISIEHISQYNVKVAFFDESGHFESLVIHFFKDGP